jgi:alkanesulfonate monooxygenase SsuD/methylene tetrahydromethanopterin reductase-like flavin-dependent oxidoreductase (luciferase family)
VRAAPTPRGEPSERARWGLPEDGSLAVGLALGGADDAVGWRDRLASVERAEQLGLHSAWVPELHFARGGTAAPLAALAAFAARSRRLRLGTTSLLLPIHHPLRLAEEVAQLDALSGGRVVLGLGRGFRAPLFDGFGVDARHKRDRFDDALDLLLRAWRGEAVSLDGTRFAPGEARGESVRAAFAPVQRPHPPLCVAAFGPKGLDQAARHGLPYLASPVETLEALEENYARHAAAARAAGRADAAVVPVMRTVHVAADDAEARRVLAALEAEARALAGRGAAPAALARASAAPVRDRVVVGTAGAVTERLGRYRERLALDLLVVRAQVPTASDAERTASLERLVGDVLPALRAPVSPRRRPA